MFLLISYLLNVYNSIFKMRFTCSGYSQIYCAASVSLCLKINKYLVVTRQLSVRRTFQQNMTAVQQQESVAAETTTPHSHQHSSLNASLCLGYTTIDAGLHSTEGRIQQQNVMCCPVTRLRRFAMSAAASCCRRFCV